MSRPHSRGVLLPQLRLRAGLAAEGVRGARGIEGSGVASKQKGAENMRKLLGRLLVEENGQGLVEYTLIVVLVALVFWVAVKNTNIGSGLAAGWSKVTDCVGTPSSCNSAS